MPKPHLAENINFLCGYLRSKEKELLDEKRIVIIQDVRDYEHLLAVVSGTFFHHALSEEEPDFKSLLKLESHTGNFIREMIFLGGEIVVLAVTPEIIEAVKTAYLKNEVEKNSEKKIYSCGLFEEEILEPEKAGRNLGGYVEEILKAFSEAAKSSKDITDLDVNLFVAQRKIMTEKSKLFGADFEKFVRKLLSILDIWFVYYLLELGSYSFSRVCKDERIKMVLSPEIRDIFSCGLKPEQVSDFIVKLKLADFELGRFLENMVKAKSPDEARRLALSYLDRLYHQQSLLGVNYIYPAYFFRKFFEQLKLIKSALLKLIRQQSSVERGVTKVAAQ